MNNPSLHIKPLIVLLWLAACTGWTQDIHFSQFMNAPLTLNPANAGFFDGGYRVSMNHKSQWSSISEPFTTVQAAYDMKFARQKFNYNMVGMGVNVFRDKAGVSEFGTTQGNLHLALMMALNHRGNHYLTLGGTVGFAQRSINFDKLTFDNQYDGDAFNADGHTGEQFTYRNYAYFDMAAGFLWGYMDESLNKYYAGFSLWHLNKPEQSFFNDEQVQLDIKYIKYGYAVFNYAENRLFLIPAILHVQQGRYQELLIGGSAKYIIDNFNLNYSAVNPGIFFRTRDALIISLGMDYRKLSFAISYDINISRLHVASLYRGGLESSIVYRFDRKNFKRPPRIPCAIF